MVRIMPGGKKRQCPDGHWYYMRIINGTEVDVCLHCLTEDAMPALIYSLHRDFHIPLHRMPEIFGEPLDTILGFYEDELARRAKDATQ
ncbi:MAG: hypothetical protein GY774_40835 [Planctomycetes bacterium]|nr:hypothetical protein [Planctomycetota bacterium]